MLQLLRKYVPSNFEVRDHAVEEVEMFLRYGRPYNYKNVSVPTYQQIFLGRPYSILQKPRFSFSHRVRILTIVLSSACDFSARQVVRSKTQSYYLRYNVYTIFSLGYNPTCSSLVDQENEQYGDILQFSHVDSYHNITLSVLYAFQWLQLFDLPVDYVFKTDSDCVINYPLLLQVIYPYDVVKDDVYMGDCHRDENFNTKNQNRKNYVPPAVVGDDVLSYYASGGGYIISYHLLPRLMIAMRHVNYLTHHEDVNTGKGMQLLLVPCVEHSDFWVARRGCGNQTDCLRHVVLHPKTSILEVNQYYSYLPLCVCFKRVPV